jgi:hypothetical protein
MEAIREEKRPIARGLVRGLAGLMTLAPTVLSAMVQAQSKAPLGA